MWPRIRRTCPSFLLILYTAEMQHKKANLAIWRPGACTNTHSKSFWGFWEPVDLQTQTCCAGG